MRYLTGGALTLAILAGAPARADTPPPPPDAPALPRAPAPGSVPDAPPPPLRPDLQQMLDAAIASGNQNDIDTIARYIAKIAPESARTVNLAVAEHDKHVKEAKRKALAAQNFLEGWKGEGQLGASQSSGNTEALGIGAGLTLTKEGLRWRQKVLARADYQRTDGLISRNQLRFSYEPNFKFDGNMFAYGLAQVERDPFSGFDARYSVSGGLGYTVLRGPAMKLDVKAGPAWRLTDYVDQPRDTQASLLAAANYKWQLTRMLTFSQSADVVVDSVDKTVHALSALDTKLGGKLSARLSWQYNYESDPPSGTYKTDTLSRVSLVYGF